jgi:thioredoxin-like negative regulator of GroEL
MPKELFYYTAPWCNPCQTLSPTMDEVAKQIPVRKQNIDYTDPAILQAANIRSVPTVVLVEDGQELRRFTGVKSFNQIIDWLNYGN